MTNGTKTKKLMLSAVAALSVTSGAVSAGPGGAPIDCAILICLAGGWPSSAECTEARAEFIRRITPFPIEPPLQIWRCPLGLSAELETTSTERLYTALFEGAQTNQYISSGSHLLTESDFVPLVPQPAVQRMSGGTAQKLPEEFFLQLVNEGQQADIDISGPAFDYVRSIRVYHIDFSASRTGDEDCDETDRSRIGVYSAQGSFSWRGFSAESTPSYLRSVRGCPSTGRVRGVGVEWRDFEGNLGHEWVSY